MKHTLIITAGLSLALLAAPVYAQSSDYETALLGQSMEARVGIIIPFGGDGTSKNSKPQLALMARRDNPNKGSVDWAMKSKMAQNDYAETRLAMTLSADPQLRLNDRAVYNFGGEQVGVSDEVKTAGKVALGAGVIVAAVLAVGLVLIAACHGDGEDAKC